METLPNIIDTSASALIAVLLIKLIWNDLSHLQKSFEEMKEQLKRIADFVENHHK